MYSRMDWGPPLVVPFCKTRVTQSVLIRLVASGFSSKICQCTRSISCVFGVPPCINTVTAGHTRMRRRFRHGGFAVGSLGKDS